MKSIIVFAVSICVVTSPLLYSSCNEDEEKLPPITMEGKNTLGCLLNGKVWLPEMRFFNQGGIYTELQTAVDTVGINIYADNANGDDGITISFFDSPILQAGSVYDLSNPEFYLMYNNHADGKICLYDSVLSGVVSLLKFDARSQIISGTFEFRVYSPDCDAIANVSDGRFDLVYNR